MELSGPLNAAFNNQHFSTTRAYVFPAIVLLTTLSVGVGVLCVFLGYYQVFQNVFYFPIILTCLFFPARGMVYTSGICVFYFLLITLVPQRVDLILPALIRVAIFEMIGATLVFIANRWRNSERLLEEQNQKISAIIRHETEVITKKLEQSHRLQKAYRETCDLYESSINQLKISLVQWNADMYITYVNPAFESLIGRFRSDLVGRKLSSIE